jgi:hypothetical protein
MYFRHIAFYLINIVQFLQKLGQSLKKIWLSKKLEVHFFMDGGCKYK